jgi:hypothetical protein
MTEHFSKLCAEYDSARNDFLKSIIYDVMMDYVEEYHEGYVCYDMDMYVALYKRSTTPGQRTHALELIYEIITDDYIYTDGIIKNFKEFIPLKPFLHGDDVSEFDFLCGKVLLFFEMRFNRAKSGDELCDSFETAKAELEQVIKIITEGDDMTDLACYRRASKLANEVN